MQQDATQRNKKNTWKILFKRLLTNIHKKKVLPSMQYGLRQGKSPLDILTHLVANIQSSFKSIQQCVYIYCTGNSRLLNAVWIQNMRFTISMKTCLWVFPAAIVPSVLESSYLGVLWPYSMFCSWMVIFLKNYEPYIDLETSYTLSRHVFTCLGFKSPYKLKLS
jgi:hypothetical protein